MTTIVFENKEYNIESYYHSRTNVPPFLAHATDLKRMRLKPIGEPVTWVKMASSPYWYNMYDIRETEATGRLTPGERELEIEEYIAYEKHYKARENRDYWVKVWRLKLEMLKGYQKFIKSKSENLQGFLQYHKSKLELEFLQSRFN